MSQYRAAKVGNVVNGEAATLQGLRVGVTSARKGAELTDALRRMGAEVCWGPTLGGDVTPDDAQLIAATDAVLAARPSWLAASTGVGMRAWSAAVERSGQVDRLQAALQQTTIVARGPKAVAGLRTLGLRPAFVSPQETDADVASWLAERVAPGQTVVIQEHGSGVSDAFSGLCELGVTLLRVAPYQCSLPDDRGPAEDLIRAVIDHELDVLTATSAPAVRSLLCIAEEMGARPALTAALAGPVAVAVIGSVTAEAFEAAGIPVTIMPRRFRTGDLLRALDGWAARGEAAYRGQQADRAGSGSPWDGQVATMSPPKVSPPQVSTRVDPAAVAPDRIELVPESRVVKVGSKAVVMGAREFGVLAALVRRPLIVCNATQLAREAWGHEATDASARVKHQISRIRRKLGSAGTQVETVHGVGYRYRPPELHVH